MHTDSLIAAAAVTTALVALLSGGGYLFRRIRQGFRLLERVHSIVGTELTPTSPADGTGESMKDDVAATAVALGHLQRRVDEMEPSVRARLREHGNRLDEHDRRLAHIEAHLLEERRADI